MSGRNPSVLFVSPGPDLATPSSGEGTRLKRLSQELSDEWEVYGFVPEGTETELPWMESVYTYDQWSLPFMTDLNPSFVRNLTRILRAIDPDVVHASKGVCAFALISRLVSRSTNVVYAAQNVEAVHAGDFVDDELPVYKRTLGPRLIPLIERATVRCADHVTTVSEKDAKTFQELYGLGERQVTPVPTGTETVDSSQLDSPESVRERIGVGNSTVAVFHGTGSHPPNREAAELIGEEIAPKLAERSVDVQFVIAGKGMPEMDASNVSTVGFVEDLDSLLHAADIAVVPIRHGGGTKTKIYDYLSHGLPMVTTEKGVEGIDLEDGCEAVVVDGVDDSFVEAVEELLTVEERRIKMSEDVAGFAAARSWSASAERLAATYDSLSQSYGLN